MPSVAPTLSFEYEKQSLRVNGVRLNFQRQARRLQNLNDTTCYEEWDGKVRERIESEVKNIIPTFETLQVLLLNVSKSSEVNLLSYIFDVLIEIRSPVKDHGVRRYLEGPFDTEIEKKSFTDSLRSTGCAEFTGITSMEIIVPTSEQRSTERGMSTVGLIAGLALATASIVLIGAAFIYVRIRNKGGMYDDSVDNEGSKVAALDDSNNPKDCFEYASEIGGVNTNTDISTLGDPIPPGGNQHNDGDGDQSTIGSVTMEYDFKKAFMDAQSVTDSQLGDSVDGSPRRSGVATLDDPSLTSDIITTTDDHYGSPFGGDEQFDVVAPAGLLGLILESNPEDGRPTVNIIKPTSVLANVVHIGDRVVSVDGQNVSTMRASDVSRLIASKKDNARVLVFVRPSKHSTFRIHEDGDSNE